MEGTTYKSNRSHTEMVYTGLVTARSDGGQSDTDCGVGPKTLCFAAEFAGEEPEAATNVVLTQALVVRDALPRSARL